MEYVVGVDCEYVLLLCIVGVGNGFYLEYIGYVDVEFDWFECGFGLCD